MNLARFSAKLRFQDRAEKKTRKSLRTALILMEEAKQECMEESHAVEDRKSVSPRGKSFSFWIIKKTPLQMRDIILEMRTQNKLKRSMVRNGTNIKRVLGAAMRN